MQVRNAPRAVWHAWRRGMYPAFRMDTHPFKFVGRKLRLGSYGDPVAVPMKAWKPLLALVDGHTGYTHQWQYAKHRAFKRILMASVDSATQATLAASRGWRTFRTMRDVSELERGEILCPASEEAGKRRQCQSCLACRGGNPQRVSIAIVAHGSKATLSRATTSMWARLFAQRETTTLGGLIPSGVVRIQGPSPSDFLMR